MASLEQTLEERFQHNQNLPISTLPDEILIRIFRRVRSHARGRNPWHKFMHVCRHWRTVALDEPTLWTYITKYEDKNTTLMMLERSKTAPLEVEFYLKNSKSLLDEVVKHTGRMRTLILSQPTASIQIFADAFASPDTPPTQLEEMTVSLSEIGPGWVLRWPPTAFTHMEHLRRLTLTNNTTTWDQLPLLPSLTHLKLVYIIQPRDIALKSAHLVHMLRNMPKLEFLSLDSFLALDLDRNVIGNEVVHMPCLKVVALNCDLTSDFRYFSQLVTFSQLDTLTVRCKANDMEDVHDFTSLFRAVAKSTSQTATPFNSLTVFPVMRTEIGLKATYHLKPAPSPCVALMLPYPENNPANNSVGTHPHIVRDFLQIVLSRDIVHLKLEQEYKPETILDLFGQLSHLKYVEVVGKTAAQFVKALTLAPGEKAALPFPVLTSLTLIAVPRDNEGFGSTEDVWSTLEEVLKQRRESGAPIDKLVFKDMPKPHTPDFADRFAPLLEGGQSEWQTTAYDYGSEADSDEPTDGLDDEWDSGGEGDSGDEDAQDHEVHHGVIF